MSRAITKIHRRIAEAYRDNVSVLLDRHQVRALVEDDDGSMARLLMGVTKSSSLFLLKKGAWGDDEGDDA